LPRGTERDDQSRPRARVCLKTNTEIALFSNETYFRVNVCGAGISLVRPVSKAMTMPTNEQPA
jgi:hypothetical protein